MRKLTILCVLFLIGCSTHGLNKYIADQEKAISGFNIVLHFKTGDSDQLIKIALDIARHDPTAKILILPTKATTYLWNAILSSGYKDHSEPEDLSYQDDIILIASTKLTSTDKEFMSSINKASLQRSSFGPFGFRYGNSVWKQLKDDGFDFSRYQYKPQN